MLREREELEAEPFLFSEDDLPKVDRTNPTFRCTGEGLWRDRPDVYKRIVKLLAEPKVSVRSICATCHRSDDTVRAVKERENIAIVAQKKGLCS
jgi:hypothetical protein